MSALRLSYLFFFFAILFVLPRIIKIFSRGFQDQYTQWALL